MNNNKALKRNWLVYAIAGLLLIGFGLSLAGEAIIAKSRQESWFLLGTIALIVFNSGISIFGQAIIYRWKYLESSKK